MLGAVVAELCLQRQISVDSSLFKIYYLGLNSILSLLTIGIEEVGGALAILELQAGLLLRLLRVISSRDKKVNK